MRKHHFTYQIILTIAASMALLACGGGGSTATDNTAPASQLVARGNVNDAKGAYDRIVDGMTLEQAMVFLGNPDYINKGILQTGTTVAIYQWAFSDGTVLQIAFENDKLVAKTMGNANQTFASHQFT